MPLLSTLNSHLSRLKSLGKDEGPIYADDFSLLNSEVYKLTEKLFKHQGHTPQEEATLCIALLTGYNIRIYFNQDPSKKRQILLDRSTKVLDKLAPDQLKCKLLLCCYSEIPAKELLEQAKEIIMSWEGRIPTNEERELMEEYNQLADF